ncbi:MAG: hypothetical protein AB8H79_10400 [Myxococcota bacterium]
MFERIIPFLVLSAVAFAQSTPAAEPSDVRIGLSSGAVVNWTQGVVTASHAHRGGGVAGRQQAVEQIARNQLGPFIQDGLPQIRATSDLTIGDLLDDPALGAVIANRVRQWSVSKATYYSSGNVEIEGQLDLGSFLRPWTMVEERPTPLEPPSSEWTGLVVDARGTGVNPAFLAKLLTANGQVLWDGRLWKGAAVQRSPMVWVNDAAHPAVHRAGSHPLLARASSAVGADLVLDATSAAEVSANLLGTRALGQGHVVVLIDP